MNTTNFNVNGQGDLGSTYRLTPLTYTSGYNNANGNGVTITISNSEYLISFYTPGFYLVTASSANAGNTTQVSFVSAVGLNAGQGPQESGVYNGISVYKNFNPNPGNSVLCIFTLQLGSPPQPGQITVVQLTTF